ncbi:MAG: tRNA pseudouridine(13) synthase TruD [Candidatus Bathyarchaeia archaeon]
MKAVFLCGGIGKRMFPISEDKFLLSFLGKPLLLHQIDLARAAGIDHFIIVGNPTNITIIERLLMGIPGIRAELVVQEKPLGIADALKSARQHLGGQVLVVNPNDVFTMSAYRSIIEESAKSSALAYILGYRVRDHFPGGYLEAFRALPPGLRRLFINAYQGYLFNRVLSLRVLEGLPLGRALKGDWVLVLTPRGFDPYSPVKADGSSLNRLNRLLAEGKACLALPIFGYLSRLSDGEEGLLERRILEEEGIQSLKGFYIGALPEASGSGGLRPVLAPIRSFSYETLERNVKFTFFLYKECYASMLLREFMKPKDPVSAGF